MNQPPSNGNQGSNQKFRPAFSKQEIVYLIDLLNRDKRESVTEMAFTIAARLKIFALKADLGIVAPAFTSTERQSLEEKLGMGEITLTQKREKAYLKWQSNPLFCTDDEVRMATLYRYENGMMTTDEESKYEQS